MADWEFFLQQQGDEAWYPLTNGDTLAQGTYRLVGKTRWTDIPLSVKILYRGRREDGEPVDREQSRQLQTNDRGLVALFSYIPLRVGAWEIVCRPLTGVWDGHVHLAFEVLPWDEDVSPPVSPGAVVPAAASSANPEEEPAPVAAVESVPAPVPERYGPLTSPLPLLRLQASPPLQRQIQGVLTEVKALVKQGAILMTAAPIAPAPLFPNVHLTLGADLISYQPGQPCTLTGRLHSDTPIALPWTAILRYRIYDPEDGGELWSAVVPREFLAAPVPPGLSLDSLGNLDFNYDFTPPTSWDRPLLLGEVQLLGGEDAEAVVLAVADFRLTLAMDYLLQWLAVEPSAPAPTPALPEPSSPMPPREAVSFTLDTTRAAIPALPIEEAVEVPLHLSQLAEQATDEKEVTAPAVSPVLPFQGAREELLSYIETLQLTPVEMDSEGEIATPGDRAGAILPPKLQLSSRRSAKKRGPQLPQFSPLPQELPPIAPIAVPEELLPLPEETVIPTWSATSGTMEVEGDPFWEKLNTFVQTENWDDLAALDAQSWWTEEPAEPEESDGVGELAASSLPDNVIAFPGPRLDEEEEPKEDLEDGEEITLEALEEEVEPDELESAIAYLVNPSPPPLIPESIAETPVPGDPLVDLEAMAPAISGRHPWEIVLDEEEDDDDEIPMVSVGGESVLGSLPSTEADNGSVLGADLLGDLPAPILQIAQPELHPGETLILHGSLAVAGEGMIIKLWLKDRQNRNLLAGPYSLEVTVSPEGRGEARCTLTVPTGAMELSFEAIALNPRTGQESHKTVVHRPVLPVLPPETWELF